ncbi:MAG: hypothetical protein COB66_07745 [Coxiella sp. (in: Bacteria)]|nr:MAG: hypothetical protein COB66_07745 [Coxiella sp. (in: g-proteobacteria)]
MLTVFYYYRFKNSLVDVAEHLELRGSHLSHETVRLRSQRISTDVALKMRSLRRGNCHRKWSMDVTYLKVKGYDMYLYRAIDSAWNNLKIGNNFETAVINQSIGSRILQYTEGRHHSLLHL